MAASSYRNFLRLLNEWPIDSGKPGIHLGQFLRTRVSETFRQGDASSVNERECEVVYKQLERIVNDEYRLQYKRKGVASATGLPAAMCKEALTSEGLSMIKYNNEGFFKRLKNRLFSGYE